MHPHLQSSFLVSIALFASHASAQGGGTWERQSPLPYPPQLNADEIAFAGARGYVVGANTGLLETTDGARTWHERELTGPVFSEQRFSGVTFFGPQNGWIIGQNVPWSNSCFRTLDGGVTWTQMASVPGADWSHVDFVSPTHGWIGAWGALYVTHDAGATWSALNYGGNDRIDSMNFVDDQVGVLSTADTLRRTQDGGQTWTTVHGHDAFAIEWLDASTVIASTQSFGGPDFARSTNGGLTWQTIEVPGVALHEPVRVDATTAISGTQFGNLYRSTDAGLSWSPVWTAGTGATINGGTFTSATDGFVLQSANLILRTRDGGESWFYASSGMGTDLEDVKMFDERRGLASGGGGLILRTEDAGRSWIPTNPGWTLSNGSPLMDLALVAPAFAFAAGNDGTLVKTFDAGRTWQAVAAPTGFPNGGTGDYWAAAFVSPNEGWIAGEYLEITHTTDGGATWTQQYVGGSAVDGVYDMDFVDAQHGWVVGSFDGVLRTVNGGATWSYVTFPSPSPHARAVDFVTPLVGWAASRDGWIARSTNGGITWTQQSVPGTSFGTNLFSMHAIDANECWVASEAEARVFRTTNGGSTWTELATPFHDVYDAYRGIAVAPNGDVWVAGTRGAVSRFGAPIPVAFALCVGDGTGGACPCGNVSPVGANQGCLNSLGLGCSLVASGAASLLDDTLVLSGSNMPNASALYFQGTDAQSFGQGVAFGDGLRCAGGSVLRLATLTNTGNGSQFPSATGPTVSVRGLVASPGLRTYQIWYRNAAPFCTASTFNLTNGLAITWTM